MSGEQYDANEVMELSLGEEFRPPVDAGECEDMKPVLKRFMESYVRHKDEMPLDDWLFMEMKAELPDYPEEDTRKFCSGIIESLKITEEKKASLEAAVSEGKSKEKWLEGEMKAATAGMKAQETARYMGELDAAVREANEALHRTITTKQNLVSKNPNLDGYIAEQYHVQTFNMNAEAAGSPYRAKVLEPNGKAYSKNGVDIEILDSAGKVVRRYQAKYYKNAKATDAAFKKGDYKWQRKLVADGMEDQVSNASNVIEAPDGTTSNPLTKSAAEGMRDHAQTGNKVEVGWNEYQMKNLVTNIGKQTGYAALQGAAIGAGFEIAQKIWNGEEIDGEELVGTMLESGADFGIKTATAGALAAGVEKGIITAIPKGTPVGVITNIAHVGIEDAKIIGKMMKGEYGLKDGLEKLEQTTVSTAAGLVAGAKGTLLGASAATAIGVALGLTLGPVGVVVGGFVGGTVGYMAGSKVGETIVKGYQKVKNAAGKVVASVAKNAAAAFGKIRNLTGNFAF